MTSIFSKIVSGEIPAHRVAENSDFLAFLDINPLAKGHVLVIPKKEVDYIFDMDTNSYTELMKFAQVVAKGIKEVIPCIKVGVAVIGLEVPHAHIHLIPINQVGDINFAKEKLKPSTEELKETSRQIRSAIAQYTS